MCSTVCTPLVCALKPPCYDRIILYYKFATYWQLVARCSKPVNVLVYQFHAFVSTLRYDDLAHYSNERSLFLAQLRDSIEGPWQQWELGFMDVECYKAMSTNEVA